MTAFSLLLHCRLRSFFSVRMTGVPRRMTDGSVRKMKSFSHRHQRCRRSFCAVRKTVCLRMKGDLRRMMNGRRMTFSRLRRSCCCRSFFSDRKMAFHHKMNGSVRRMKSFSHRHQRCRRSFCAGHSRHGCRCGLHSFCGQRNILLYRCRHGPGNRRAGHSRRDCRWSSSCDCHKTFTLRQRRMKRQAPPSFSA